MEYERKVWRLNSTLRSNLPSSICDDVTKKLAFMYLIYERYYERDYNKSLQEVAGKAIEISRKIDLPLSFDNTEFEEAYQSGFNDIIFFGNDARHSVDLIDLNQQMCEFSADELLKLLNSKDERTIRDETTPDSVIDLVLNLATYFGLKSEKVTDMCCAKGDFLLRASKCFKKISGIEHNTNCIQLAKMRLFANNLNGNIIAGDCFRASWEHQSAPENKLSDLVFCEFPWRLVVKDPAEREVMYNCNANRFLLTNTNTTDFFFMSAMMNFLKEDGLAFAIMPVSSLTNLSDKEVRKHIIERGFLKAVVTLPSDLFSRTAIVTALVIFGKKPNEEIHFFDGSKYLIKENRRYNTIDVQALMKDFADNKGTKIININSDQLSEHDYSFSPAHYISDVKNIIPNATDLENVADIFTGWQCTSSKLESIHRTDGSGFQLLQMSNVENGSIVSELERYDIPESTVEKFKVVQGDVVISTKSLKVKSAVVDLDTSEPIIASGSIMVIRPKAEKLDPYFLVSFFESAFGQTVLRMYQTGAVIPNLSIGNVKKIPLPCLDIEEQRKIGSEYKEIREQISDEKRRLKLLQDKANTLLDNLWDKKEGK